MGLVLKSEFSLKTILLPSLFSFPGNLGMELLSNFTIFEIADKIKMLFG